MASEDVARRKAMAAVNSIFERSVFRKGRLFGNQTDRKTRYHLINRTQIRKEPVQSS